MIDILSLLDDVTILTLRVDEICTGMLVDVQEIGWISVKFLNVLLDRLSLLMGNTVIFSENPV